MLNERFLLGAALLGCVAACETSSESPGDAGLDAAADAATIVDGGHEATVSDGAAIDANAVDAGDAAPLVRCDWPTPDDAGADASTEPTVCGAGSNGPWQGATHAFPGVPPLECSVATPCASGHKGSWGTEHCRPCTGPEDDAVCNHHYGTPDLPSICEYGDYVGSTHACIVAKCMCGSPPADEAPCKLTTTCTKCTSDCDCQKWIFGNFTCDVPSGKCVGHAP